MNQINKYKELLEKKLYYEAHEALEELWFPIRRNKDDYTFLLKGFINAAVSLELFKRDKKEQSKKIYQVYKKYVAEIRINKIDNGDLFKELKLFVDTKFDLAYLDN